MIELKIEQVGGNDLLAQEVRCTCNNDELFKDKPHLGIKRKVRLSGYNDRFFFDEVNKQPRNGKCRCGRAYTYQWLTTHVNFGWDDEQV